MRNHFQILSVDDRPAVTRLIIRCPKLLEVLTQSRLSVLVERAERLLRRTVIKPKVLDNVGGRERKIPVNVLKPSLQFRDVLTESLSNSFLDAPKHRRRHPRRRWKIRRIDLKHPSDEPARRPVGHRDETARTANSLQLRGHYVRTRCEHRSKHRHDCIKTRWLVRQWFRIAFVKLTIQSRRFCVGTSP